MRKRWLIAILSGIILLTGVPSTFALDANYKPSREARVWPGSKYSQLYGFSRDKLSLWERRYWREFKLDFDKEGRQLYRRLLQKKSELRELLREQYPDMTKIHRLIDELASIWAEIQKKAVDTHLRLKGIFHRRGWVPFPSMGFGFGFWMGRSPFPRLHGYWWYWEEHCPFSPFE